MGKSYFSYTNLVVIHCLIGFLVFKIPQFSTVYGLIIPIVSFFYVIKSKNKNNEILMVCAYVSGLEVFLRMTGGGLSHEIAKYVLIFFMTLGCVLSGFSNKSIIYIFLVLLLIPGIYLGIETIDYDTEVRKALIFNIIGPICLLFSSTYCYNRSITYDNLNEIIKLLGLSIISMLVYVHFYTPDLEEIDLGTQSNFDTSGGFGPNQVSTVLGLSFFIFSYLFLFGSKNKKVQLINIFFACFSLYRGLITFSRGGVYTGAFMVIILLISILIFVKRDYKLKIIKLIGGIIVLLFCIWSYSVFQTKGMIEKRYANKDRIGREKDDDLGGRGFLNEFEINTFINNPIFGVGVGRVKGLRAEKTGIDLASHNELTRLLAEHGFLGVIIIIVLLITPIIHYFYNTNHIILLSLYCFWLLTINHAAMRIAAPAFIYALTLLKIKPAVSDEKNIIHRE